MTKEKPYLRGSQHVIPKEIADKMKDCPHAWAKGCSVEYGAFPYQKAKPVTDTHPVPPLTEGEKDD